MNENKTLIAIVADHSGSMSGIAQEVTGAIAAFIKTQQEQPGELDLYVAQFDSEYSVVYGPGPSADYQGYTLIPRGMTALNDGIGKTIVNVGSYLAALPEADRPAKVILIIATDGGENSSVEFPSEQGRLKVKAMIEHQETKYGWQIQYIANGMTAQQSASGYGLGHRMSGSHNTRSAVNATYAGLSQTVSAYRGGQAQSLAVVASVDEDGNETSAPSAFESALTRTIAPVSDFARQVRDNLTGRRQGKSSTGSRKWDIDTDLDGNATISAPRERTLVPAQ